jgi:hypothetical protein
MVAVGAAKRCSSFLHDRFSDMVALAIQGKAELWGYAAGHVLYMSIVLEKLCNKWPKVC